MFVTLLSWPKKFLLILVDSFFKRVNVSRNPKNVMIVRLDLIGDFFLWLDSAYATVSYFKKRGMHVTLLANDDWAALAQNLGLFDQVLKLNKKNYISSLKYRIQRNIQIRNLNCSVAIHPTYSRELFTTDSVMRICGAEDRIGSAGDFSNIRTWQKKLSNLWYTRLIPSDRDNKMELLRNAEFVSGLTGEKHTARVFNLKSFNSPFLSDFENIVKKYIDGTYFVICPGASFAGKRWPLERFAQTVEYVQQKTGWRCVVCGNKDEVELARKLGELLGVSIINLAGVTTVSEFVSIVAGAKLVLANDSSSTHIAAAAGIPVLCIAGGGQYGRFVPYEVEERDGRPLPFCIYHRMDCFSCNWNCKFEIEEGTPMPCVGNVSVSDVKNAVDSILATG